MGVIEWELGSVLTPSQTPGEDYFMPKVIGGKMVTPDTLGQILMLKQAVQKQKDTLSRREVAGDDENIKDAVHEVVEDTEI